MEPLLCNGRDAYEIKYLYLATFCIQLGYYSFNILIIPSYIFTNRLFVCYGVDDMSWLQYVWQKKKQQTTFVLHISLLLLVIFFQVMTSETCNPVNMVEGCNAWFFDNINLLVNSSFIKFRD